MLVSTLVLFKRGKESGLGRSCIWGEGTLYIFRGYLKRRSEPKTNESMFPLG